MLMRMRGMHLLFLLCLSLPLAAVEEVMVLGLFKDKAVLRIDGNRRVLAVGQTSPEGVKLIAADSDGATLEIDGEERRLPLGSHIGATYSAPQQPEVQIWPDTDGMYKAVGSINGFPVNFLVDTGATSIAMNERQARRLGIDFRLKGKPGTVTTASGVVEVYGVRLDRVKVGDILLRNVQAVVLTGGRPEEVLLGMSFLGRLDMRRDGQVMLLKKKF